MFRAICGGEGLRRLLSLRAGYTTARGASGVGAGGENDSPPAPVSSLFPKVHFRTETRGETRRARGPAKTLGWPGLWLAPVPTGPAGRLREHLVT